MSNNMNTQYKRYIADGYQFTGIVLKEWEMEEAKARAAALRVDGTKAVVVRKTELNAFRYRVSKDVYLCVLEKPSEVTLAKRRAEREAQKAAARQRDLTKMAEGLTVDEIMFMLKLKV